MVRFAGFIVLAGGLAACARDPLPLPEVPDQPSQAPAEQAHDWAYEGPGEPTQWASLRPEWSACGTAPASPIDVPLDSLAAGPKKGAEAVTFALGPLALTPSSDGRVLQLAGDTAQTLTLDGKTYTLGRALLHTPGEHRLGGIEAALELELQFELEGSDPVALNLLFRTGLDNPALVPLLDVLPKQQGVLEAKATTASLDLATLLPRTALVFSYAGSQTTPPCQPMRHLVVTPLAEISGTQLQRVKQATGRSARPLQAAEAGALELRALSPAAATAPVPPAAPTSSSSSAPPAPAHAASAPIAPKPTGAKPVGTKP